MKLEKMPLVSIVIVTYNQERFIDEAILAALNQNYDNIEIIVADDASKDNTRRIIQKFVQKYPGKIIPVYGEKNQGVSFNCNRGLHKARGKFICWQGGDDIVKPEKVKQQVIFLENNADYSICYHDVDVFNSEDGRILFRWSEKFKPQIGNCETVVLNGCFMCACSIMFRANCMPTWFCDLNVKTASDWLLVIETLATNNTKIGYLNKSLAFYRRHQENLTNVNKNLYYDHILSLNIIESRYRYLRPYVKIKKRELELLNMVKRQKQKKVSLITTILKQLLKGNIFIMLRICVKKIRFRKFS